jgi:hypothetical protein
MNSMRILLQQTETGLYFKDVGIWTSHADTAMDFLTSTAAIDFCVANKLKGVQLVLKFEEHRYNIVLPVAIPGQTGSRTRPSSTI